METDPCSVWAQVPEPVVVAENLCVGLLPLAVAAVAVAVDEAAAVTAKTHRHGIMSFLPSTKLDL